MKADGTLIFAVRASADGGGICLEAEPIPHDLGLCPVGEKGFRNEGNVFKERIADDIVASKSGPRNWHYIVCKSNYRSSDVSSELFDILEDVAFEIGPQPLGCFGIGQGDDCSIGVDSCGMILVDDCIVVKSIEVC